MKNKKYHTVWIILQFMRKFVQICISYTKANVTERLVVLIKQWLINQAYLAIIHG